jgi:type IV pilus assembly protein PilM
LFGSISYNKIRYPHIAISFKNVTIRADMIWNLFKSGPSSFIGVDIGTFSIKVIELSKQGNRRKLENYGEIQAAALYEKAFRTFEKSTLTVSEEDVVKAIKAVLTESDIKTNRASFSIPDFSTFFTTFELPPMTEDEISQAVQYEARQHIPLPLSEVTLDWQVVEEGEKNQKAKPFRILLVAVPNEVISQYQQIALNAKLELAAMEAEVFALARSLGSREKEAGAVCLIDIGARSTTVSIVDNGTLKLSHSFDTSGNDFTNVIARGMNLDYAKAEEMKREQGLNVDNDGARSSLIPLVDLIVVEVKKIIQNFHYTQNKDVQKIILAGGSAYMPGLVKYLADAAGIHVEIINPFADIYYPPILEETLKNMGPSYAIALGTALRGFE